MGDGKNKNKVDELNIKALASGQEKNFVDAKGQNRMLPVGNGYYYQTGIVLDVIHNPKEYFLSSEKRKYIDSFLTENDRNFNFIEKIPKNAILCQIIDQGKNEYKKPSICFPFFPSHISLPIKPGEHAWIMTEVIGDVERLYWVSRKHAAHHVENLNYTHYERELSIYDDNLVKNNGSVIKAKEARLKYLDYPQVAESGKVSLTPSDIHKSSGFNIHTLEPVPDIVKLPGDLLLQGSNNAIMHLTQEKFTSRAIQNSLYPINTFTGKDTDKNKKAQPFSPAIDICVARKKSQLIEVKNLILQKKGEEDYIKADNIGFVKNFNLDSSKEIYEINKLPFIEEANSERNINSLISDYDVNIKNCGARIYLSNNCDVDNIFNIGKLKDSESSEGQSDFKRISPGSSLATYSEHTRMVTDGTFRIVNNFSDNKSEPQKSGSTYIEIDEGGKVSIGSLNKVFPSVGGENIKKGMQPFVKGDELQDLMERLIISIQGIINILDSNFSNNATPGFGGPSAALILAALELTAIPGGSGEAPIDELETIKNELNKFKSTLIQGE